MKTGSFVCRAVVASVVFAVSACGGGGGGAPTPAPTPTPTQPSTPTLPLMVDSLGRTLAESDFANGDANAAGADGTAADKTPIANAPVVLSDNAGHVASGTTDAQGYYRVSIKGFVPPFVARVTRSDGNVWYAQSTAPVQTRAFVTVNINGVTDKVASYVAVAMNLGGDASKLTPALLAASPNLLQAAKDKLNAGLVSPIAYAGLASTPFDPVGLPYQANGTQAYNKLLALVDATKSKLTGNTVLVANYAGGRVPDAATPLYTDGPATAATFGFLTYVAADGNGNLYVADTMNGVIRKATPAGVFSTFAGNGASAYKDGVGTAASFNSINSMAVDSNGNLLVADLGNNAIRKITPDGTVSTLAGNGAQGFANGAGAAASFSSPRGVAVDAGGNVYVADYGNNAIRKITPAGVVSTVAGGTAGFGNGTGTAASFKSPVGVAVGSNGNLFVVDQGNNAIRQITPAGDVSTLAGSGAAGAADGAGTAASFNYPGSIAVDGNGNVLVVDNDNYTVRKITPLGLVSTFAGSGLLASNNGTGTAASFYNPQSITVASNGNVIVAEWYKIRLITPAGVVSTLAGDGTTRIVDGPLAVATLKAPTDVAVDSGGNMFVADSGSRAIRKISPAGMVSTVAGNGTSGFADGVGTAATFNAPQGVALDGKGNLYVADTGNHAIRMITPAGVVSTLAGNGSYGFANGTGTAATFNSPQRLAVDNNSGMLYVADFGNHSIRKISPSGVVTTLAGSGTLGFVNGIGTAASFNCPKGLLVDAGGTVIVADSNNKVIRKIAPDGTVSTFAGSGQYGFVDGTGTAASFNTPSGVALDGNGNLLVADTGNHGVRSISPAGVVTTLMGDGPVGLVGMRPGRLTSPSSVTALPGGDMLVTDPNDSVIWKLLQ